MRRSVAVAAAIVFFVMGIAFPVSAGEPAAPELTLQQVIDMALAESSLVKSKEYAKEQAWEAREDASEDVYIRPEGGAGPSIESAFTGLMQSSLNYRMKGKELEQAKKEIRIKAYTKYANVLIAKEKVKYAEIALEKEKLAERVTQAHYLVGMAAMPEITGAESKAEASAAALQAAREDLEKAYIELNSLIGLQPGDRPELVDDIEFNSFSVPNIKTEISRAENNNENLWNLEQLINLQKMDLKYFNYGPGSGQLQAYDVEKYDVDVAELNAEEVRKQVREGVQTLYKDIKALEEQYNMVSSSIKALEEQLRVTQVRYDVGMATKLEVTEAATALAEVKQSLAEMRYDHAIMVANFKNMTGKDLV